MDYTLLVNKDHPLDKDYVPNDLVIYPEYNGPKVDKNHVTLVHHIVLNAFYELQKTAYDEAGYYFIIDSAYRSYEYQKRILDKEYLEKGKVAYSYVAVPGTSEHQSGLAIDIALYRNGVYTDVFDDIDPEIKWIQENAYRFGFILRYPKGCEAITGYKYECWHFRYVGHDVSLYMNDNNIRTLEEYHSLIRKNNY